MGLPPINHPHPPQSIICFLFPSFFVLFVVLLFDDDSARIIVNQASDDQLLDDDDDPAMTHAISTLDV